MVLLLPFFADASQLETVETVYGILTRHEITQICGASRVALVRETSFQTTPSALGIEIEGKMEPIMLHGKPDQAWGFARSNANTRIQHRPRGPYLMAYDRTTRGSPGFPLGTRIQRYRRDLTAWIPQELAVAEFELFRSESCSCATVRESLDAKASGVGGGTHD